MGPLDVLKAPSASPSSVWAALKACLGVGVGVYETETFVIELHRRGVEWSEALSAKVLGAQTIVVTNTWAYDHDVLFAFALATDGIGAASDAFHHPTVIQLAWAVREIESLRDQQITEDHGFDPDAIDPAVAIVLHEDGWVYPPDPLAFCKDSLARMDRSEGPTRAIVAERWPLLRGADDAEARKVYDAVADSPLKTQLGLLFDCELELRARARLRQEHHDACTNPR